MVAILGFSREKIIAAVQEMYTAVATAPGRGFHFPVGRRAAISAGYPEALLQDLPATVLDSFAGVGCPFRAEIIRPGNRVLDIGSGSGTDALIASRLVGEQGKVWALDVTPAMVNKLRSVVSHHGIRNVEVLEGQAERIPLADGSVDVVTSNGALNLVPDKRKAVAEICRVLKPGGRVQIADIVINLPVTPDCEDDPKLWAECVVGATVEEDYLQLFHDAGFEDVSVLRSFDYFSLSGSAETREIAQRFGAHGIELTMQRAQVVPSALVRQARRFNPLRAAAALRRRGWAGSAALAAAVVACYGTLAAVALLSMAGISVAVNTTVWAGTIVALGALAAAAVGAGVRKHGSYMPASIALAGALLLAYVQLLNYSLALELVSFGMLGAGVLLDSRRRRNAAGSTRAFQSRAEA
jgi:arsenite methyltransferase